MNASRLFDLTGRTALVTGASSGLGRHFAATLAANGARVALAARRGDLLGQACADIEAAGGMARAVELDVTDRDSIAAAFDAAEAAFGVVDVLVNNAGIAREALVLDQSAEDWRAVLGTNLDGAWFVAQAAARRMVAAGRPGSIVNVASVLGFGVSRALSAYAVAKAGVVQLTRAMALELARNRIRVNAIAPGYVLTDMNREFFETGRGEQYIARNIPMRRIGDPADLDGPLLLLASDASAYMTGSVVVADGGQLVRNA